MTHQSAGCFAIDKDNQKIYYRDRDACLSLSECVRLHVFAVIVFPAPVVGLASLFRSVDIG